MVELDLQLAFFIPITVVIYRRSELAGNIFVLLSSAIITIGALFSATKYGVRVGILAYENWDLFAYMI